MFEKFTNRARRVIVLAQEEARMLSHNYIGTEHLLLGLLAVQGGLAYQILDRFGVSPDGVREEVVARVGTGHATSRIRDGQRVRVDGGRGVVTLLD